MLQTYIPINYHFPINHLRRRNKQFRVIRRHNNTSNVTHNINHLLFSKITRNIVYVNVIRYPHTLINPYDCLGMDGTCFCNSNRIRPT